MSPGSEEVAAADRRGAEPPSARWLPVAAALIAALLLWGLKAQADADRIAGVYYQGTSSERLMQTVSALDLALEPGVSLWYLHIQPPLFDAIRALATAGFRGEPVEQYEALNVHVDRWLYRVWGLVYLLIVALSAHWLGRLTSPGFGAVGAVVLTAAHPASIFYATFLDSTILGAWATLWISYELWAVSGTQGSLPRLTAATIFACLARSHFQWPIVIVVAAGLGLRKASRRRVATYVVVAGSIVSLVQLKQYLLFGLPTTSSFAGQSGCRSIRAPCEPKPRSVALPAELERASARVLHEVKKPAGWRNFNHLQALRENVSMMSLYRDQLVKQALTQTLTAYRANAMVFLEPSSTYARHTVVKRMPWRGFYNGMSSGWVLVGLLLAVAAAGLRRRETRVARLGLALPILYVSAISVLFESRENMRYKFFVEPVLWIALTTSAFDFLGFTRRKLGLGR